MTDHKYNYYRPNRSLYESAEIDDRIASVIWANLPQLRERCKPYYHGHKLKDFDDFFDDTICRAVRAGFLPTTAPDEVIIERFVHAFRSCITTEVLNDRIKAEQRIDERKL
jgi:hypothetical protein